MNTVQICPFVTMVVDPNNPTRSYCVLHQDVEEAARYAKDQQGACEGVVGSIHGWNAVNWISPEGNVVRCEPKRLRLVVGLG